MSSPTNGWIANWPGNVPAHFPEPANSAAAPSSTLSARCREPRLPILAKAASPRAPVAQKSHQRARLTCGAAFKGGKVLALPRRAGEPSFTNRSRTALAAKARTNHQRFHGTAEHRHGPGVRDGSIRRKNMARRIKALARKNQLRHLAQFERARTGRTRKLPVKPSEIKLAEHAEVIRTLGKRAVGDIIEIGRRLGRVSLTRRCRVLGAKRKSFARSEPYRFRP